MANRARSTTRRTSTRSPSSRRRSRGFRLGTPRWQVSPDVARSLVGIFLLALGAVTLIALALPGQGTLTTWWRDSFAPWFGSGRWLLPFVLLAAGIYVERARTRPGAWELRLVGAAIAFLATLGLIELFENGFGGGIIGHFLASVLSSLVSRLGAIVVLLGVAVAGLLLVLDASLGTLLAPVGGALRGLRTSLAADPEGDEYRAREAASRSSASRRRSGSQSEPGLWDDPSPDQGSGRSGRGHPSIPVPGAGASPVSSTFASSASSQPIPTAAVGTATGLAVAEPTLPPGTTDGTPHAPVLAAGASRPDDPDSRPSERHAWNVPPLGLLEDIAPKRGGASMDHVRNAAIITAKLASFNIPARVDHWNAGPVVTQYEVEPAPEVKVSRIEGLADDLAMALAARTLRVEAPIPGRTVVGIEIPNIDFNIVALRRIAEEADFRNSASRLTFALGRDVAGHARSVDLARMPHLLIAGATGSGKSVMVNAVIASLLMRATPDEVRLILVDLKRVELASYNGVPHLLVPVITEPERAKAALKWAVGEMEHRYRRLAGATARNIAGYNETRVNPDDRMPYIVIIVDELADLMMREGRNVEDPIVRLAQKARATGIHMVLATQRPSVNVVTGLIKANFPSRIAFAMASQIDSRTILDAPGAEDLIGRGDMLYQPADLPRPVRLQGVFVSDKEIGGVTDHWRAEAANAGGPHYDLGIIENDEESSGSVEDKPDEEADRLLLDAVRAVQEYDRASASLLQRRLKIGYARAARIIDQLESRGYVGPFDGSNARQVLRREVAPGRGSPGWTGEGDETEG